MLDSQSGQIDPCEDEVVGHIAELPEGVETLHEGPNQQTESQNHNSLKIVLEQAYLTHFQATILSN